MSYTINNQYKARYYGAKRLIKNIKYIVVHYTANSGTTATAKSNANYFANTTRKASAHYIVDEGSIIYQSVSDDYVAYSVGDTQKYTNGGASMKGIITNSNSISIEMVSHTDSNGTYYIPDVTIQNTIRLIKDLQKKYTWITNDKIHTHHSVTGKLCPAPLVNATAWANFKALLEEDDEMRYKTIKEMPSWSQSIMQDWVNKKIITGDQNGNLDMSDDMIRMAVFFERRLALEKK